MSERPDVETLTRAAAAEEVAQLARAIRDANRAYHVEDAPEISDAAYDALKRRLLAIETRFPDLKTPDSPSEEVGAPPSETFAKVRHAVRMLSLENAFDAAEIEDFDDRIRRYLNLGPEAALIYTAEPKIDGLSLSLALRGWAARPGRDARRWRDGRERDRKRPHHRRRSEDAARCVPRCWRSGARSI